MIVYQGSFQKKEFYGICPLRRERGTLIPVHIFYCTIDNGKNGHKFRPFWTEIPILQYWGEGVILGLEYKTTHAAPCLDLESLQHIGSATIIRVYLDALTYLRFMLSISPSVYCKHWSSVKCQVSSVKMGIKPF